MTSRETAGRLMVWTGLLLFVLLPAAASAVDCDKVNVSPVADFEFSVMPSEAAPLMVNFYSTPSRGGRSGSGPVLDPIDTFHWNFGDGSVSDDENPLHSFASGSARFQEADRPYPVTLTIRTVCERTAVVTKNVSAYCLNHTPGFAISQPAGGGPFAAPVALAIRDTSLHTRESVTSWHYTVWDAGMTRLFLESTEKDPSFIIRNGGTYVLRQEIHKSCSAPETRDTDFRKTIEVTGSAESDAIPMETLPVTPAATESSATAVPTVTFGSGTVAAPARTPAAVSPAATLAPGTGSLVVSTSPPGAKVYVNEMLLGTSPVTIPGLGVGQYNLRLEKDGYRNDTVRVEIGDRRVTEYAAALEPPSPGIADPDASSLVSLLPLLAVIIGIAACAGAAAWYLRRRKKPPARRAPDGNALFLIEELGR